MKRTPDGGQRMAEIASKVQGPMGKVYELIAGRERDVGVSDSPKALRFTPDDLDTIRANQWEHVRAGQAIDGAFQSLSDVKKNMTLSLDKMKELAKGRKVGEASDGFFNQVTGIGTGMDPGAWNAASTPVSLSPQEATAAYSNGGIGAEVIDKKSRGIILNGYGFECDEWKEDDLKRLKGHAEETGFTEPFIEWWRDGLTYGGAGLIPALDGDDPMTYQMSVPELAKAGMLKKGCIQRWWGGDRWNMVLIPDYDISHADYLMPREFIIPITGLTIDSSRISLARPRKLPYWGAIRQMGWGVSDFVSFLPSLLAYELAVRTIPIISQQLSLVYLHTPMDAAIIQNGINAMRDVQKKNQVELDNWSWLNPKLVNFAGELKSIDRHFTDFDKLVLLLKQDVGAKAGYSHTVLFNESTPGMDEKSFDITLKEAAQTKRQGNGMSEQSRNAVMMLVYSCFGVDSPQAKTADKVRLTFEQPTIPTMEENVTAMTGAAATLVSLRDAGIGLEDGIEFVREFLPNVNLSEEFLKRMKSFDSDGGQDLEGGTMDHAPKGLGKFWRKK